MSAAEQGAARVTGCPLCEGEEASWPGRIRAGAPA